MSFSSCLILRGKLLFLRILDLMEYWMGWGLPLRRHCLGAQDTSKQRARILPSRSIFSKGVKMKHTVARQSHSPFAGEDGEEDRRGFYYREPRRHHSGGDWVSSNEWGGLIKGVWRKDWVNNGVTWEGQRSQDIWVCEPRVTQHHLSVKCAGVGILGDIYSKSWLWCVFIDFSEEEF